VFEKFREGGWVTLVVTALVVAVCFWVRGHYVKAASSVVRLYQDLHDLPETPKAGIPAEPDRNQPVAAVLVGLKWTKTCSSSSAGSGCPFRSSRSRDGDSLSPMQSHSSAASARASF